MENIRTVDPAVFAQFIPAELQKRIDNVLLKYKYAKSVKESSTSDLSFSLSELEETFIDIPKLIEDLRILDVPDDLYRTALNSKIKNIVMWKGEIGVCVDTIKLQSLTFDDEKSTTVSVEEPVSVPVKKDPVVDSSIVSLSDEKVVDELYNAVDKHIETTPTEKKNISSNVVKQPIEAVPVLQTEKKNTPSVSVEEADSNIIVSVSDSEDDAFDETPDVDVVEDDDRSFVEENEQDGSDSINTVMFEEQPTEEAVEQSEQEDYVAKFKSKLDSVKLIKKASTNSMIKLMSRTNVDPATVKLFDIDVTKDVDFQRLYLESRNNMLATPRVSRVAHVLSGFFSEISAYSEYDLISINRNIALEKDFVRQEMLIYNSIFAHVMYTSFKNKGVDFKEWCEALLLPDINSLFFGVYDANYPGVNEYQLTCGQCKNDIEVRVDNDELACYINSRLSKDYVKELISLGDAKSSEAKMLTTPYKDDILKKIIRKKLSNTGIIVEYGMPTLQTYLETITALQDVLTANDSKINISDISDASAPMHDMLRIYLYVKGLGMPVKSKTSEDGNVTIKYLAIRDRTQIVSILSSIGRQDFSELFTGKEVKDLANIQGTAYYIKDVYCEKCKMNLQPVVLNPQETFFFKLGEEPNKLQLTR